MALAVLLGGLAFKLTSRPQAAVAAPPPPAVTVSPPLVRKEANWTLFSGQFSALNNVQIRAEVSGYLTEIHFQDGQIVHQGDLLFVIDPRPYQIALDQANAAVLAARAALTFAVKDRQRVGSLQGSGAATAEQYDQRVQADAGAQATLAQAHAQLRAAQLNLQFCHITAPFTGRISNHLVSVGGLVMGGASAGSSTLLTTLVSLDPIHLDFQMSEDDYLAYRRYIQATHMRGGIIQAALDDERGFPREGSLDFIDNAIDPSSGTIHARATLPNHDMFIAPGDFAELRLPSSVASPVLLVPDSALQQDQSAQELLTVTANGTVVPKIVRTGPLVGNLREIDGGVGPGDKIIINGLMQAQPGSKVTPEPGSIKFQPDQQ